MLDIPPPSVQQLFHTVLKMEGRPVIRDKKRKRGSSRLCIFLHRSFIEESVDEHRHRGKSAPRLYGQRGKNFYPRFFTKRSGRAPISADGKAGHSGIPASHEKKNQARPSTHNRVISSEKTHFVRAMNHLWRQCAFRGCQAINSRNQGSSSLSAAHGLRKWGEPAMEKNTAWTPLFYEDFFRSPFQANFHKKGHQ